MQAPTLPFHVMAKPAGPSCQLRCSYCFYTEKKQMFPADHSLRMPDALLERFVREYIASQPGNAVEFAWQGGEPTLRGLDFFRRAVQLQQQYAGGRTVTNAFQTNGLLVDDEWAEFLAANRFLVGVSLDGPPALHNACRVDSAGRGTHTAVLACIDRLQSHGVEFNTLTVVNARNAERPLEVYRHLKAVGARHLQFIPLVERRPRRAPGAALAGPPGDVHDRTAAPIRESVTPLAYGRFLTTVFQHWVRHDVGVVFEQLFESTLHLWVHGRHTTCVFAEECGRNVAMEHDGSVYACDHYVYPAWRLGQLGEQGLQEMLDSPKQRAFGAAKRDALPAICRNCPVLRACWGGCPKHRFLTTPGGEPGLNYFCASYRMFFQAAAPFMGVMARLLRSGRPAAEVMELATRNPRLAADVEGVFDPRAATR